MSLLLVSPGAGAASQVSSPDTVDVVQWVTLVSSLLGVVLGAALTYAVESRTHRRLRRLAWNDRGLDSLGAMRLLLKDASPSRVLAARSRGGDSLSKLSAELTSTWEAVRVALAQSASGHPSVDVRQALRRLLDGADEFLSHQEATLLNDYAEHRHVPRPQEIEDVGGTIAALEGQISDLEAALR